MKPRREIPGSPRGAAVLATALLRALPHRAARGLGAGLGRAAWACRPASRARAREAVIRCVPHLDGARLGREARLACRSWYAARLDALSAHRFRTAELCRRLSLEGWERLAEARHRGWVHLVTLRLGTWEVGCRALDRFAAPVDWSSAAAAPEAGAGCRGRVLGEETKADTAPPREGEGATILPFYAVARSRGRYLLRILPAVASSAHCRQAIEDDVRGRPELRPWAAVWGPM